MEKFYKYLYWDEAVPEKDRNRIKWRIKVGKRSKPCFVVTLSMGPDQLEIYNSLILLQKYYRENPRFIIGIAKDYDGAVGIVKKIAEECYLQNGNLRLKDYLAERTD